MRRASTAPAAAAAVRGLSAAVDQGLRMDGATAREALHPKKPSTPAPSPHHTLLQRPSAAASAAPRADSAQAPSEPYLVAACWRASGGVDASAGQQPVAQKAGFATLGSGPRSPAGLLKPGSAFAEGRAMKRAKRAAGAGEDAPAGAELQCGYRGR